MNTENTLQRRGANREPRYTSPEEISGPFPWRGSLFMNGPEPSSPISDSFSRHVRDTTASSALLQSENIPNLPELRDRESATCRYAFTKDDVHEPTSDTLQILSDWKSKTEEFSGTMYHVFHEAGTGVHNTRHMRKGDIEPFNTWMNNTLAVVHQIRKDMPDQVDSDRATKLQSLVDDFEARYKDFEAHLRLPAYSGSNDEPWREKHSINTLGLCRSVADMVPHLPPFEGGSVSYTRHSQPPSIPRLSVQEPGPSAGSAARSIQERTDTVTPAPSRVSSEYVPSPIDPRDWKLTEEELLAPPSPSSSYSKG